MDLKSKLYQAQCFWKYYGRAQTRYNVQTPFVFNFIETVLENKQQFYAHAAIEGMRGNLLKDPRAIDVRDFGAGSQSQNTTLRKVKTIARAALSAPFQCGWLFNIVDEYQPKTILEIGTSLGISTLYLRAAAQKNTQLITLEGDESILGLARIHFHFYDTLLKDHTVVDYDNFDAVKEFELTNDITNNQAKIESILGDFSETLPVSLRKLKTIDLAFIDGNHRYDATMQYFEQILPFTNSQTILIFDDIYWSSEMTRAWNEIKKHSRVTCSIDLFWCGIIFFTKDILTPQHLTLIRARLKPFKIGWSF